MPPSFPSAVRPLVARLLCGMTAVYVLLLVFATHYPKPERLLAAATTNDKLMHFLAYGLLATLAGGSLAAAARWTLKAAGSLAAGLMTFAALDEITQPLFPPRTAEPFDWFADCIGIGIGLVGIAVVVAIGRRLLPPRVQRQLGVGAR